MIPLKKGRRIILELARQRKNEKPAVLDETPDP
jgi:hypothetical protein